MNYKYNKHDQGRKRQPSIYYKAVMIKSGSQIVWRAVEMPSKLVLDESFFEEDVKRMVKFQNKNKTFGRFGFPKFFDKRTIEERKSDPGRSSYNYRYY